MEPLYAGLIFAAISAAILSVIISLINSRNDYKRMSDFWRGRAEKLERDHPETYTVEVRYDEGVVCTYKKVTNFCHYKSEGYVKLQWKDGNTTRIFTRNVSKMSSYKD